MRNGFFCEFCMQRANEDIEEGTGKGGVGYRKIML